MIDQREMITDRLAMIRHMTEAQKRGDHDEVERASSVIAEIERRLFGVETMGEISGKQSMMAADYVISLENAVRRWKRIALLLFIAGTVQWVLGWLL